ncbi:MAG: hypothetical protein PHR77_13850 [Kiritimatiellae bacterium]|nr:hypothetical protein [Kiritimatiellia bacterium]MDD5520550.1 hypothetical protein [Kiritimatiellia bacterium]
MSEDKKYKINSTDAFCPSCERFIGPVDVCPYCDCDSARNPLLRFLRYGAILLAITGLFFLYLMAVHSEVPVIKISEITPMMNFGLVRINGVVEKDAYISKKRKRIESVSFPVGDGSGQIRVVAYTPVAEMLVKENLVPARKSLIEATGNLNISANGNTKLILRDVKGLSIESEKKRESSD